MTDWSHAPYSDNLFARSEFPATSNYIRDNFEPNDRLAVLLIRAESRHKEVTQRLLSAAELVEPQTLGWMIEKNHTGHDLYVSMNALTAGASGRTKEDIAQVRHLFVDLDSGGRKQVEAILKSGTVPHPSYILESSANHYQLIWKTEHMAKSRAEELTRGMAQQLGGDRAATDISRVLRLPGGKEPREQVFNWKYAPPEQVRVVARSRNANATVPERGRYREEDFHKIQYKPELYTADVPLHQFEREARQREREGHQLKRSGPDHSRSGEDIRYSMRALARGEDPAKVAHAIAEHRSLDKSGVRGYAERTVKKAMEFVRQHRPLSRSTMS